MAESPPRRSPTIFPLPVKKEKPIASRNRIENTPWPISAMLVRQAEPSAPDAPLWAMISVRGLNDLFFADCQLKRTLAPNRLLDHMPDAILGAESGAALPCACFFESVQEAPGYHQEKPGKFSTEVVSDNCPPGFHGLDHERP